MREDHLVLSAIHDIVSRELAEVHVSQRGSVEDLVTERAVCLHRQVETFVTEVQVQAQIILRHRLAGNVTVATIVRVETLLAIDRLIQDIGPVTILVRLAQAQATRDIEHAHRLAFHHVNDVVVTDETGTTHVRDWNVL